MRFFANVILSFLINIIALVAASYYIPEFQLATGYENLLWVAGIFALLNVFVQPILKALFTPIIWLTLGFGIIFVNALILYILDKITDRVTIAGLMPLLYATLIISVVNFLAHGAAKMLYSGAKES